jgi:hypothetical protein
MSDDVKKKKEEYICVGENRSRALYTIPADTLFNLSFMKKIYNLVMKRIKTKFDKCYRINSKQNSNK